MFSVVVIAWEEFRAKRVYGSVPADSLNTTITETSLTSAHHTIMKVFKKESSEVTIATKGRIYFFNPLMPSGNYMNHLLW
jgi:hypothetical protein